MGLDPDLREQEQIALALQRHGETLTASERRAEAVVSGGFVIAVAALVVVFPPTTDLWHPLAAVACLVALIVAFRAEFDVASGFTVPSQVAFVPLLFTLPPSLAPVAVVLALMIAYLPDVVRGTLRSIRLLRLLGSAWFSVGPALVLSAAGAAGPADAAPLVLVLALAAQLVCDLGGSTARELLVRGASLREQLREGWVYAVDLALTPIGLLVAWHVTDTPWAVLAVVPLLGVLGIFGRERRRRVESLLELNNAYRGTALLLGNVVEADDHYTGNHCRGVVELALKVGEHLDLGPDRLRDLEFAALLHDVGKVAIPKEIINKPGKLDPHEWQVIKTHTIEGQRMLDQIGGFMSEVGRIVRSHHERWDGNGYPDGMAGEAIPIEARIIACCDTWNAMTTTRSYRAALPRDRAAQEIGDCSGTQFDPDVVAAVLAVAYFEAQEVAADRVGRQALAELVPVR
jgi:putative nucleotidyltransferase with HDIG domain